MLITSLLLGLSAQAAPAAQATAFERVRQAVRAKGDWIECGRMEIPNRALALADLSPDGRPDVVVDYTRVVCPKAQMQWTGSAGTILEVWSDDAGPVRAVMSDNVYAWRIRGAWLVTDQPGTACGERNYVTCRVTYGWDAEEKALIPGPYHVSALTLDEEDARRFAPLKARVRARVLAANRGCRDIKMPAHAIRPIGDATGDGRSEILVDFNDMSCRGEAARWFSTGGPYTEVWTDHGGRLRRIFADHADWGTVRERRLVTEEHPVRCGGVGGPHYCEVVRRFDRRRGKLVVQSRTLKPNPGPE